jgi:acyl-coenzyme A synthetase/AMP-(fatty) acid ligase
MLVLDSLDFHTRSIPQRPALVDAHRIVSFAQLGRLVRSVVARMRAASIPPGALGICAADPLLHGVLMLAAMHDGRASCTLLPDSRVPAGLRLAACLTDQAAPLLDAPHWAVGPDRLTELDLAEDPPRRPFEGADPVLRITFSSGTTGLPKAMLQPASTIGARTINEAMFGLAEARADCLLTLLTMSTSWATVNFLRRIVMGGTQAFARGDREALAAMQTHRVDVLVGSPAQLRGLAGLAEALGVQFPALREVNVGGSAINRGESSYLRANLCPNLVHLYGSSEVGMLMQSVPGPTPGDGEGFIGLPYPWVSMEVVDTAHRPLPPGQHGRIRIRSNGMTTSYMGDPEASAQAFHQGWFYPGDLGRLLPDGRVQVTGREGELINAGGVKTSPLPIRDFLVAQPGVRDAAVMGMDLPGMPTEIWAAIEADPGLDLAALDAACRAALGPRAPSRLVPVASLPRNGSGKVEVASLRTRLAAG